MMSLMTLADDVIIEIEDEIIDGADGFYKLIMTLIVAGRVAMIAYII